MKILGQYKQVSESQWWVGERVVCYNCHCYFELEAGDMPAKHEHRFKNRNLTDFINYDVDCPSCKKLNTVRQIEL